jgi:hypothetical protein
MKKQNWVWTLSALAVLASPLTLDHLVGKLGHEHIYRSIASNESEEKFPHLTRAQEEQVKEETPAQAEEKRIVVIKVVKLTINDPALLKKLNDEINAEKKKGEELQSQLKDAQDQLAITQASLEDVNNQDKAKAQRVQELEKAVEVHVARITELDSIVLELEKSSSLSKQELEETKLALEAAKVSADEASKVLVETQTKLDESTKTIALKDEELKTKETELSTKAQELLKKDEELAAKAAEALKKEEELKLKNEELAKSELALQERTEALEEQKESHDLYVCKSEEKFVVLGKQIEDLNKQQQQFTQVMLGLNQVLIGLFSQMQNMNQGQQPQILGMQPQGYFGQAYMPNPYATGQLPSPSAVMGNHSFNPWMQQSQQPIINNYYGPTGMGQGQQSMMPQPQYFMPNQGLPGSFDFGAQGMNDGSRAVFGAFGPQGQPNAPQIVPQMTQVPVMAPQMAM